MRYLFVAVLLSNAAFAQQPARVSGRVVDQSGAPVRRANVKLFGGGNYTQTSDDNGAFTIENIAPGRYTLIAQRTGYSTQKYGASTPLLRDCTSADAANLNAIGTANLQQCAAGAPGTNLTLAAGQEMQDLTIRLTQQGSISGRLTNQDGEPVPAWQVQASKVSYEGGKRQVQSNGFGARTDPDGNFAIASLAPGRYYLYAVNVTANMFAGLSGDRQGKSANQADLPAYYPSEAEALRAAPVDVTPGAELHGMDVRLRHSRVYAIRGSAKAPNGGPPSDQLLTLNVKGARSNILVQKQSVVRPDGTFEFREIEPGTYVVSGGQAWGNAGAAPPMFARAEVTVSNADVEGVTLSMVPERDLTGTIGLEGGGKPASWPVVLLQEFEGTLGANSTDPDATGAFRFPRPVAPSSFVVSVLRVPAATYVKSIRFGNQDAIHAPLDLTGGGGGSVDVVLSAKVATVSGVVKKANGEPAAGVVLSLWPRVPVMTGGVKSASTDQDGRFEISDLGPGDYFLSGWEEIDPGLLQTPEFLARFQSEASTVRVEEGARVSADARLITRERVTAEVAKLP